MITKKSPAEAKHLYCRHLYHSLWDPKSTIPLPYVISISYILIYSFIYSYMLIPPIPARLNKSFQITTQ